MGYLKVIPKHWHFLPLFIGMILKLAFGDRLFANIAIFFLAVATSGEPQPQSWGHDTTGPDWTRYLTG